MKVLHVVTGLRSGGAEVSLYKLCVTLSTHLHVVVSLMDEGKFGPMLRAQGIRVVTLEMPRGRITLRGLARLRQVLDTERPDLVQTWMYHSDLIGGVLARWLSAPTVCWGIRHSDLAVDANKRSTIMIARLCAVLSRWVPDRIVCCAEQALTVHQALGYDVTRCVVIPNGYDVSAFQPSREEGLRLRDALGIPAERAVIGLVARFDPQKDHANLFRALARVRDLGWEIAVVLVGAGMLPDNNVVADLVEQSRLAGAVHLLGRRDDIPVIMSALDLHVLSSSCGEAFPNVLAEAMACGIPCVTTDVGDGALIVGDTGWVVPPRDPGALAQAIVRALNERRDVARWARRQREARTRVVDKFSLQAMADAYDDLWTNTAQSWRQTPPHS